MSASDTPKPSDVEIESDPQPQSDPKPAVPEEDDQDIKDTEEQPT